MHIKHNSLNGIANNDYLEHNVILTFMTSYIILYIVHNDILWFFFQIFINYCSASVLQQPMDQIFS